MTRLLFTRKADGATKQTVGGESRGGGRLQWLVCPGVFWVFGGWGVPPAGWGGVKHSVG